MANVFLLIGSNQGDRLKMIDSARAEIARNIGRLERESSIYETEPWGFKHDQHFLNQLLVVYTEMTSEEVLAKALEIEEGLGRERTEKQSAPISPDNYQDGSHQVSARTMDIDILFYDSQVIDEPNLTIPHPRLHKRRFALVPLNEIAEDMIHPVLGKSMRTLMKECKDQQEVALFTN